MYLSKSSLFSHNCFWVETFHNPKKPHKEAVTWTYITLEAAFLPPRRCFVVFCSETNQGRQSRQCAVSKQFATFPDRPHFLHLSSVRSGATLTVVFYFFPIGSPRRGTNQQIEDAGEIFRKQRFGAAWCAIKILMLKFATPAERQCRNSTEQRVLISKLQNRFWCIPIPIRSRSSYVGLFQNSLSWQCHHHKGKIKYSHYVSTKLNCFRRLMQQD